MEGKIQVLDGGTYPASVPLLTAFVPKTKWAESYQVKI